MHFVPIVHPEKGADWPWPFDNEEFLALYEVVCTDTLWELYTAKLFDDLEKLPSHIVGHFYVPATLGRWPAQKALESYEDRLLEICHERGLAGRDQHALPLPRPLRGTQEEDTSTPTRG